MFAVCGTSLCDGGDEASVLEIFDQRPIVLGREEDDGSIGPGSTLCVSVEDSQPAFVDAEGEGLNAAGAFCIHVMTGFTHAEAKAGTLTQGPPSVCKLTPSLSRRILRRSLWAVELSSGKEKRWLLCRLYAQAGDVV